MRAFNDLRRLALNASVLFLALLPMGVRGQQTPQAIPLSSGACKLDGTVGCGGGGGGGGTGLLTLNGLTADPQFFAKVNDTNVTLTIGSVVATHTFTLGWTGSLGATRGGTGQSTYTLGDLLYSSASNTLSKLAGNTTTTRKFLRQVGNGSASAAPAWDTLVAGDVPTLNQSTTGSAATLTTPRAIYGNNFDGSAALTQVIASTYGGTGNGFTKFSGPTTSEKTFTLPDASATLLTDAAAVTAAQGGTGGTSATAYGVVLTGTTGTGAFKLDLGPGTSTYVLTSNGAGAYPTWQPAAGGANTALSNLASVAINAPLATGAGTAATLTATPAAAITTSQAGIAATINASAATAGSSVAGAAAGGPINLNAGAAARFTSGNANGGDIIATGGAGIGTGTRGTFQAPGAGTTSTVIGSLASATGTNGIAIGTSAAALGGGVAIGTGSSNTANNSTAVGQSAAAGDYGVSVGTGASTVNAGESVAIGSGSTTAGGGGYGIAIGRNASGTGSGAIALGRTTSVANTSAFAVGVGATSTADFQMVFGAATYYFSTGYFGSGVTDTSAKAFSFRGTGGSGANNVGANLTMEPGLATGTAASGDWYVRTGIPRATGSTAQSAGVRQSIRAKQTTLTESTATSVVTIPVAASKIVGGRLTYTVSANDGTDFQSTTGEITFSAVDKAGTVTTAIAASAETSAASAGTLSSTWTAVASTTNVILKCNAVSSLTQTVLEVHSQLTLNGDDTTGTVTWN